MYIYAFLEMLRTRVLYAGLHASLYWTVTVRQKHSFASFEFSDKSALMRDSVWGTRRIRYASRCIPYARIIFRIRRSSSAPWGHPYFRWPFAPSDINISEPRGNIDFCEKRSFTFSAPTAWDKAIISERSASLYRRADGDISLVARI